MQVLSDTFGAVFEEFERLLATCEFYAVDEEMTGITLPTAEVEPTQSAEEAYAARRAVVGTFSIIQFGIALFHREPAGSNAFIVRPFNFYVFPATKRGASDALVTLSASTVRFLSRNHMDFQKWLTKSVWYVDAAAEAQQRAELNARRPDPFAAATAVGDADEPRAKRARVDADAGATNPAPESAAPAALQLTKPEDQEWFEKTIARFRAWLEDARGPDGEARPAFAVEDNSRLQRLFFEQEALRIEPRVVFETETRVNDAGRRVWKRSGQILDDDGRKAAAASKRANALESLERGLGFRRVWNAMVSCKKPLVGHNCHYDWLFMWAAFERPLPDTLAEFKTAFHAAFPAVYDTKWMVERGQLLPRDALRSTGLESVYTALAKAPTSAAGAPRCTYKLPLGFQEYASTALDASGKAGSAAHEAGYDAYMTGVAFAELAARATPEHPLSLYLNKGYLMYSVYNVVYDGPDERVFDGPVYIVRNMPSDRTPAHVESAFSGATDTPEVVPPPSVRRMGHATFMIVFNASVSGVESWVQQARVDLHATITKVS